MAISILNARLYKQVSRTTKQWEETFKAVTDPIFLVDLDYNVLRHNGRLTPEISPYWEQALSSKCFTKFHGHVQPCKDCPLSEVKRTENPVQRKAQTDSGSLLRSEERRVGKKYPRPWRALWLPWH